MGLLSAVKVLTKKTSHGRIMGFSMQAKVEVDTDYIAFLFF